jgi:Reverse transcriptase (RNA-dependent DNA polymerase)
MAKAFDTVRHDFSKQTYKFFGIGEKFTDTLTTISTDRTASIIFDDGTNSKPFKLGSGYPQGNNPSPKQFNLAAQVLIFKVEFDPRINKIVLNPPIILENFRGSSPYCKTNRTNSCSSRSFSNTTGPCFRD